MCADITRSRLTKCCTDIRADRIYSLAEYDVTSYFRSAFTKFTKRPKMPLPAALGRIIVARRFAPRFDLASPNSTGFLHTRRVYNHTGNNFTMYFRSEVIDVRKRAESDAYGGFNLES